MKTTNTGSPNLNLNTYEFLRTFHSQVKDFLDLDLTPQQKNAIETLHGLLYLVEKEFTNF